MLLLSLTLATWWLNIRLLSSWCSWSLLCLNTHYRFINILLLIHIWFECATSLHEILNSLLFLSRPIKSLDLLLHSLVLSHIRLWGPSDRCFTCDSFGCEGQLILVSFVFIVLLSLVLFGLLSFGKSIQLLIFGLTCTNPTFIVSHNALRQIILSLNFRFEGACFHFFLIKDLFGMCSPSLFVACSC